MTTRRPGDVRVADRPGDDVQRRTISTLVATQMLGGLGVGAAISVNALLAKAVSGPEQLAGLAQTCAVLGAAVITLLLARIMDREGRRPGLSLGYAIGVGGAAISIIAGVLGAFPLLLLGATMLGGTTAANNQSRYAATDLSHPAHRGRDLSLVVWATTVGSVIGPNLTGPGKAVAAVVGIPALTGAYVIAGVGMLAAMAVMVTRLRPDPLLLARARHTEQSPIDAGSPPSARVSGWTLLRENRLLRLAALGLALCHAVGADTYINASGGTELYAGEDFAARGIALKFLQSTPIGYSQFGDEFVPWLSIIDVMMFNPKAVVAALLGEYKLT